MIEPGIPQRPKERTLNTAHTPFSDCFLLTPYFLDQPLPGLRRLAGPAWEVIDPPLPEGTVQHRLSALYENLAEGVAAALRRGDRPVSLAGDCCSSLGVLAGLQRVGIEPFLIWFDAHGDFNTWETTPSGFLGGMPLAMLVGRGEQSIVASLGLAPLSEHRVLLTDGRDLDPGERTALESSQVQRLPDVADLLTCPLPEGPLWVHFDTDVVDAAESPAQNYPVTGGPSVEELREVFRCLARTGQVCAVSLSAWNPALPGTGVSAAASMSLLGELAAVPR